MIIGVLYPCIGIGYWIGSYLMVHCLNDHRGGVLMFWNWGLDWVIPDGTLKNDHGGGFPLYWNWVLVFDV